MPLLRPILPLLAALPLSVALQAQPHVPTFHKVALPVPVERPTILASDGTYAAVRLVERAGDSTITICRFFRADGSTADELRDIPVGLPYDVAYSTNVPLHFTPFAIRALGSGMYSLAPKDTSLPVRYYAVGQGFLPVEEPMHTYHPALLVGTVVMTPVVTGRAVGFRTLDLRTGDRPPVSSAVLSDSVIKIIHDATLGTMTFLTADSMLHMTSDAVTFRSIRPPVWSDPSLVVSGSGDTVRVVTNALPPQNPVAGPKPTTIATTTDAGRSWSVHTLRAQPNVLRLVQYPVGPRFVIGRDGPYAFQATDAGPDGEGIFVPVDSTWQRILLPPHRVRIIAGALFDDGSWLIACENGLLSWSAATESWSESSVPPRLAGIHTSLTVMRDGTVIVGGGSTAPPFRYHPGTGQTTTLWGWYPRGKAAMNATTGQGEGARLVTMNPKTFAALDGVLVATSERVFFGSDDRGLFPMLDAYEAIGGRTLCWIGDSLFTGSVPEAFAHRVTVETNGITLVPSSYAVNLAHRTPSGRLYLAVQPMECTWQDPDGSFGKLSKRVLQDLTYSILFAHSAGDTTYFWTERQTSGISGIVCYAIHGTSVSRYNYDTRLRWGGQVTVGAEDQIVTVATIKDEEPPYGVVSTFSVIAPDLSVITHGMVPEFVNSARAVAWDSVRRVYWVLAGDDLYVSDSVPPRTTSVAGRPVPTMPDSYTPPVRWYSLTGRLLGTTETDTPPPGLPRGPVVGVDAMGAGRSVFVE